MKLDLSKWFGDPPEIRHLHWQARAQIRNECRRRKPNEDTIPAGPFFAGLGLVVLVVLASPWIVGLFGRVASVIAIALPIVLIFAWMMRGIPTDAEVLRQVLLERNIRPARCFRCRYDLRGSDSPECPECGEKLVNRQAEN